MADEIGKIVRQDVVPKFSNSETAASNIIFEVNMIGFKSSLNRRKKDREYWKKSGNKAIMKKITDLLKDIAEYPYTGIGKPEPLKYELAGYWSRRINSEHRIIYSVHDDIVTNILNFYEISL